MAQGWGLHSDRELCEPTCRAFKTTKPFSTIQPRLSVFGWFLPTFKDSPEAWQGQNSLLFAVNLMSSESQMKMRPTAGLMRRTLNLPCSIGMTLSF